MTDPSVTEVERLLREADEAPTAQEERTVLENARDVVRVLKTHPDANADAEKLTALEEQVATRLADVDGGENGAEEEARGGSEGGAPQERAEPGDEGGGRNGEERTRRAEDEERDHDYDGSLGAAMDPDEEDAP